MAWTPIAPGDRVPFTLTGAVVEPVVLASVAPEAMLTADVACKLPARVSVPAETDVVPE